MGLKSHPRLLLGAWTLVQLFGLLFMRLKSYPRLLLGAWTLVQLFGLLFMRLKSHPRLGFGAWTLVQLFSCHTTHQTVQKLRLSLVLCMLWCYLLQCVLLVLLCFECTQHNHIENLLNLLVVHLLVGSYFRLALFL